MGWYASVAAQFLTLTLRKLNETTEVSVAESLVIEPPITQNTRFYGYV
jgi:hypothetical protein